MKAPAIPASADAWLPQAAVDGGTASSFDVPEVTLVETDLLAGYQPLNEWPAGWVESFTSHGGKLARSPQRRQERRKVVK